MFPFLWDAGQDVILNFYDNTLFLIEILMEFHEEIILISQVVHSHLMVPDRYLLLYL